MKIIKIVDTGMVQEHVLMIYYLYYEKRKNIFIITGGSFLGFNTLPAISREIAYKVNNKKLKNIDMIYQSIEFIKNYLFFIQLSLHSYYFLFINIIKK